MKPKILLVHGWGYSHYTSSGCNDAWSNRTGFTDALLVHFHVIKINLPGFCGENDPETAWTLDNFVHYIDNIIKNEKPLYILGYSFGGAVALRWKNIIKDKEVKLILVSPAIIRKYNNKNIKWFQKILKKIVPKTLVSRLRDLYLTKFVKNPCYSNATKVMRETYRNIVVVDLRNDLKELTEPVTLIYGENDSATPFELVRGVIGDSKVDHKLKVISGGGHDIANSHTEELISLIVNE